MSDAKFTKGPWIVKGTAPLACAWTFDFNEMDIGFSIDTEEFNANTHLIAAAPDMYAMIEMLIANYQSAASVAEHEGYETRYAQDRVFVDLLLAKARGE